jgi:hypothetical protein
MLGLSCVMATRIKNTFSFFNIYFYPLTFTYVHNLIHKELQRCNVAETNVNHLNLSRWYALRLWSHQFCNRVVLEVDTNAFEEQAASIFMVAVCVQDTKKSHKNFTRFSYVRNLMYLPKERT